MKKLVPALCLALILLAGCPCAKGSNRLTVAVATDMH